MTVVKERRHGARAKASVREARTKKKSNSSITDTLTMDINCCCEHIHRHDAEQPITIRKTFSSATLFSVSPCHRSFLCNVSNSESMAEKIERTDRATENETFAGRHRMCEGFFFLHLLSFVSASSFSTFLWCVGVDRQSGSILPNVNWGESEIEKW